MSDTKELEVKAKGLTAQAASLSVIDRPSYDAADALSSGAKLILKAMDDSYDPVIKAAHEAHKAAVKAKKDQYTPVEEAMKTINAKMTVWFRAEQAKADEARRAAEVIARKAAEDAAISQAEMLQSMGMNEAAEEAISTPVVVEAVRIAEPTKAEGVYYRDTYSAECFDLMALCKAVARGEQLISCISPNETVLNGLARTLKDAANIPGVRIIKTTTQGRR